MKTITIASFLVPFALGTAACDDLQIHPHDGAGGPAGGVSVGSPPHVPPPDPPRPPWVRPDVDCDDDPEPDDRSCPTPPFVGTM